MTQNHLYDDEFLKLWYKQPGTCWSEALPLGNGRMGAMIYGNTKKEVIDLTEITCFSGEKGHTSCRKDAFRYFYQAREDLLQNDYKSASENLRHFVGKRTNYGTHLPMGHLTIQTNHSPDSIMNYQRSLCLRSAVSTVSYDKDGTPFTCTVFISNPHQIMVMKLLSAKPDLNLTFSIDGGDNPFRLETYENDLLLSGDAFEKMHSDGKTGVSFHTRLRVIPSGGSLSCNGKSITVKNTEQVLIYLAFETNFNNTDPRRGCKEKIENALRYSYEDLLQTHVSDYRSLFQRVSLYLGKPENAPTDVLLKKVKDGCFSPFLSALMFQYGRYLLISSSRANSPLPAPLQGVWNDSVACRIGWTCDMHLDINTQMNYWPSEMTNLSECHLPLFDWIENRLLPSGRETAKIFYNLNGWVAELVSNAWGFTDPYWHINLSPCPTGGAWIATHMWEHYQFTGSMDFLKNRAFPVIQEAASFFVDYVFPDPNTGYLTSGPSISPENHFCVDGKSYSASLGPYYEITVIRELFDIFIKSSDLLGYSGEPYQRVKDFIDSLPPFQAGKDGELKEWSHRHDATDSQHRHTSHLLSLFPFAQITPEETPELAEAARKTIQKKLVPPEKWEDTGWARCMLMLYSARLKDRAAAIDHINILQRHLTHPNLMVKHPPTRGAPSFADVYELDGNTGLTACIAEMLLQSHRSEIELLPVVPKSWPCGYVKGLCARGGYVVDMEWKNGLLVSAVFYVKKDNHCRIRHKNMVQELDARAGEAYCFDNKLNITACDQIGDNLSTEQEKN